MDLLRNQINLCLYERLWADRAGPGSHSASSGSLSAGSASSYDNKRANKYFVSFGGCEEASSWRGIFLKERKIPQGEESSSN